MLWREDLGASAEEDGCVVLTRTDGSPAEHCHFGEAMLVMELQHHRCCLCLLAVDEMLTKSKSHTGERNRVLSAITGLGFLVAIVNVCSYVGVAVEEVWNSFEPVIDSTEEAMTTPGS